MDAKLLYDESISLRTRFLKYMGPSVVAMWVFSLYTMVDGIFVAKGVGETALAAVNISMPFINFIFAISLMFSTGASTVIAMYLGKKDIKSAKQVFNFNTFIVFMIGIIITIVATINLEKLAMFLGATETTLPYVKNYLGIIIYFNVFFIVSYSLEVIVKTDGFPALATMGVTISAISNMVLDYLFIMVFNWGVQGAAIATGLSQVFSTVFFLLHFLGKKSTLKFSKFKIDLKEMKRLMFIGFPDSTTELSCGIVVMLFNISITKYIGEQGVVYYSILNYVNTLILMTMMGISQGMQPLVSFYFGAEKVDSMKKLLKMAIKASVIAAIVSFAVCRILPDFIVGLFINPSETHIFAEGVRVLKIYAISFLFMGFNVIISAFFVSVEKPVFAAIVTLGRGLFMVVAALFITIAIAGGEGIWYSTIISESVCMITAFILLKLNLDKIMKTV